MNRRSHFLEGILVGIGVAVAGYFFANSTPGKKLRYKVQNWKDSGGPEDLKGKAEDVIAKTMHAIETGFGRLEKRVDAKRKTTNDTEEHA